MSVRRDCYLIDTTLRDEVLAILAPIHNWHYTEGRPENNDEPCD